MPCRTLILAFSVVLLVAARYQIVDSFSLQTPGSQSRRHNRFQLIPKQQHANNDALISLSSRRGLGRHSPLHITTLTLKVVSEDAVSKVSSDFDGQNDDDEDAPASIDTSFDGALAVGANLANSDPPSRTVRMAPVSKFRQLKDIMWIRETLEDLTAAEFALSVESEAENSQRVGGGGGGGGSSTSAVNATATAAGTRKKKRAVDYEKLLTRLTTRVEDMTCVALVEDQEERQPSQEETNKGDEPSPLVVVSAELKDNSGMGRYVYSQQQRSALLGRIMNTRQNLKEVIQGHLLEEEEGSLLDGEGSPFLKLPEIPDLNSTAFAAGPKLYVRDDGTVDWEGALQDRAALRKFGGAVWARINGQTPDDFEEEGDSDNDSERERETASTHETKEAVTAKIEETEAIQEARSELHRLRAEYKEMQKAHTALLSTGISAGQPVANVKLAALDPALRNKIRLSAEALLIMEQQVSYQSLVYDLERIYTYLAAELGNPASKGYIPLQDRLNVAEYGLLESQVESCSKELDSKGVLDADILAVIAEQMTDFKRRLGIDYYVAGLTFDQEAIQRWLSDLWINTVNGVMFYVKGTKLFWNDVVYCISLIGRAAQGFTLEPRQVRTLRRTVKDIITFIPVVIILIIPMTPVGHVLVFGAIQRFFPDFFPSCFTEQRQNLLQLYETTEFSEVTIKESFQERVTRFFEFLAFFVASKSRSYYKVLTEGNPEEREKAILWLVLATATAAGALLLKRQSGLDVA